MTAALCGYSGVFMRYSMAVTPKNYLLFGCHLVNFTAQSTQAYRFVNWWYMGGREKAHEEKAKEGLGGKAQDEVQKVMEPVFEKVGEVKGQVQSKVVEAKEKTVGR